MVQSLFKTGVVAHIVGMPANTLRVWERRYGLQCSQIDDHGHRLYSADDVQRIAALRQLTLQGHAIGIVARRTPEEVRHLLSTQDQVREAAQAMAEPARPPRQLWVVGAALATRINRAAPRRHLRIAATLDALPQAPAAPGAAAATAPDALLLHLPSLHVQQVEDIAAAATKLPLPHVLVVYGYSNSQALRRCAELGVQPWRDTHNDRSLVSWIVDCLAPTGSAPATTPAPADSDPTPPTAPQYDAATLADWSTRKTDIACECPAHIAELLLRVQQFESYSADCEHRSEEDRQLHEQLHRLAGRARLLFERAMQLLAEHEQAVASARPGALSTLDG
ncbi:MerR family transcriptional regulator [Roseateles sp. LYH14W]|uniref:MerR family transcriptional regulator n=1 Tax=Pelomonas parva TaxID=3299032 RepID=A0ABW7FCZ9_9BURK